MVSAPEYHERTKHSPRSVRSGGTALDFDNKPTPHKTYLDLPSVPLTDAIHPAATPALRAIADPDGAGDPDQDGDGHYIGLDLDALTQLCWLSAGITKIVRRRNREMPFRAAACTGALYHVDLYPVVGDVDGLDAGVYHFDPRTLSLDVLREGDYRGVVADAAGHEHVAEAPVSFVLTSTWWRNAWKYGERTYRHAFWDSGTILANLLATARTLDRPASVVTGFADEQVADLLGVDPAQEAPLEVVPVGRGNPAPDPPAVEPIDPATEPLSPDPVHYHLIEEAYRESTLPDGDAVRRWREADTSPGPDLTRDAGDGDRVELDPVGDRNAAKTPLHRAIRRRGSCREYERDALNGRKVSTVLDRAFRGVPTDVGDDAALSFNDAYLIVHDVEGFPSGAYHYHPGGGELERLRSGEFRDEAGHLALDQRLAADAGMCVFFLTDLEAVTDRLGDRGYRVAQLEAAITAGRLYIGAYAHRDLGATGLTFYDDIVTEFFEPRAAGQTPTFLWTLGRPA